MCLVTYFFKSGRYDYELIGTLLPIIEDCTFLSFGKVLRNFRDMMCKDITHSCGGRGIHYREKHSHTHTHARFAYQEEYILIIAQVACYHTPILPESVIYVT